MKDTSFVRKETEALEPIFSEMHAEIQIVNDCLQQDLSEEDLQRLRMNLQEKITLIRVLLKDAPRKFIKIRKRLKDLERELKMVLEESQREITNHEASKTIH